MEKDKIEVGEYIRTKKGNICKVLATREKSSFITNNGYTSTYQERYFVDNTKQYSILSKPYVVKHSKNIIDLIEVGDYVNGSKVIDIAQGKTKAVYIESQEQKLALIPIVEKQIKSIVTKEQFKEMEYKV